MSASGGPIRVVIVDDHPFFRDGLRAFLSAQPDIAVVAEGSTGKEVLQLAREHRPDVVLAELRLPGMGGIESVSLLQKEQPGTRAILLTAYGGEEEVYQALQAGAHGYLLKSMPRDVAVDAVRAVARGERYIPAQIGARLAQRITGGTLTPREIEVLEFVSKGLSNGEIAGALSITDETVKAHVKSIMGKLEATDRTEAVTVALRRGIIHLH